MREAEIHKMVLWPPYTEIDGSDWKEQKKARTKSWLWKEWIVNNSPDDENDDENDEDVKVDCVFHFPYSELESRLATDKKFQNILFKNLRKK